MKKEELFDIYQRQTETILFTKFSVRNYSGDLKRIYRLLLVHYFAAAFTSNEEEFKWSQYKLSCMHMASNTSNLSDVDEDFVKEIKSKTFEFLCENLRFNLVESLEDELHKSRVNDGILNSCVNFMLSYINQDVRTLFLYSEIKEFWDVNLLYKENASEVCVLPGHWIELVPFKYNLPIHTFPEYFAYQDMINIWNDTIEKYAVINDIDFNRQSEIREKHYSFNSSLRTSLILGVHFFETYLYYLYYNLKQTNEFSDNRLIKRSDVRKINDKQIVETLLYNEFPDLELKINVNYQKYLETLEYRDALVHMSAFSEKGFSRMQYLLDINIDIVSKSLQNIVDMVEIIDIQVEKYGILFWKGMFEWPIFNETHKNSTLTI
ncbi:hypothetical protein [Sporosarcina sp. P7]|uniref:hypothetical protein n=1 Tax=Sporosarcina sp. P7 TaxID=2048244 RepID=UPI000C16B43A|nr:hypothetical protein [Sporosarcina sp. P7]PID25171.1 hypothetical protein CSV60_05955 [Sporosarcina sp. P7]